MLTPSFDSFAAFLAMGGHGFYVWLSLVLAVLAIAVNLFALRSARRRFLAAASQRAALPGPAVTNQAEAAALLLRPEGGA